MTPPGHNGEIIAGDDLVLKKIRLESAGAIFGIINRNRHYLRQWMPFVDNTWKSEDTEMFIRSVANQEGARRDIIYEIWHKDEFSGLIALKDVDRWNKKAEIGYWLDPDLENKGIMTRCCIALINCAFREMHLHRIQIKVGLGNARSSRIAEKLGFRFEGIERDGEKFSDRYISLEVYSLLKNEWKPGK